jgi:hypothetical protein
MSNKLTATYSSIVRFRTALAEAVEAQRAAEALATEASETFAGLVAKSGFSTLQARQFTALAGDSIQCELARAHAAEQFADHGKARAIKERQAVEQRLADTVASCRALASDVGSKRAAEIPAELLADKVLRGRLLDAYGAASLPMASELGCTGWVRWEDFAADLFATVFRPEELDAAASAAVRHHLVGER